jgi:sec-independent protein translocase protein TatA
MMPNVLAWGLTMPEMMLILIVALLLFGKRLPEVARSMGKSVVEFKKGLQGIEEDLNRASDQPSQPLLTPSSNTTSTPPNDHPAD